MIERIQLENKGVAYSVIDDYVNGKITKKEAEESVLD
jgi:hypothetical protein